MALSGPELLSVPEGDEPLVAAIYDEGIAEGRLTFETHLRSAGDVAGWLGSTEYPVLVAERDGEVAGWARMSPYSPHAC